MTSIAPIESGAEEVRPDRGTSAFAWDTCLADEGWTSSLTDRGGQALMGSAVALAAIELYAMRRRNPNRAMTHLDSPGSLRVDPRGARS